MPLMRKWGRRLGRALLVVALLAAALVAWQWRSDLPLDTLKARWAGGASRFVDVDGMSVHYRDEGRGAPVVLLHGTGSSLHTWDAWTAALLASGRRVVRFDLPGFGLTGPHPHSDYRITAYVEFVDHMLTRLGIDRFALGGNSLGGDIAWRYATAHPTRVSALVLVDAAGHPIGGSRPLAFRIGRMPVVRTLMAHLDPRWLVARTVRQSYGDPARVTPALVERYRELLLRAGNRAAFGARTAVAYEDHTAELAALKLPVLIVWGARDRLIPVENAHKFAAEIAGAELRIYDELGHVPMEEDGARTGADVAAFLSAHRL
jgi:pimeloyl-ACP methyl ester carboxylesterase